MPYTISWLVEKRIVYIHTYGLLTGEELVAQNLEIQKFVPEHEHLLNIITDGTDTTGTNMGLRDLQKTQFSTVDNLGWAIYISPSKMNRFFASVITQLSQKRGRQFATLDEGLKFLQDMDDTLPPLTAPDKTYAAE